MSGESIPVNSKFGPTGLSVVMNEPSSTVTKSVKFVGAFCLTYGQIIGSGIFITVKPTFLVFESNSIGMVMIFWALGGLISLIGGLCYAELGTRMPESGGERAYYKRSIALAALSLTVGKYLSVLFLSQQNATIEKLIGAATKLS
ncbi:hypothetical protein MXB_4321 [Myxobolus squamalis]|nr:hypothetical protein MXB_4321 [Myxobolus squamalis]